MPVKGERLKEKTPLTIKQRKLIKYFILCDGNIVEASKRANLNYDHACWLLKQEKVDTALQKALAKAGLTTEYLAKGLYEGTKAEYPEKKSATTGIVIQEKSPDYFTRHKYYTSIIEIRGDKAPEKSIEEKRVIHLVLSDATLKGLADAGKIKEAEIPAIMGELQHVPVKEGENVSGRGKKEEEKEERTSRFGRSPEESERKPEEDKQDLRGSGGREGSVDARERNFNPQKEVEEALKRLKESGGDSESKDKDRELEAEIINGKEREAERENSEQDR